MARLRRRCAPSSGSSSRPLDAAETMRGMQPAKLTTGKNDDEAAVRHFVVLVKPATNDVVIHDDGDDAASPYQDRKVIAAVRERLDRGVTVRCLFNNRADLRRVDELRDHPGFTVHYLRQPPLSPEDVHFKIVDRGRGPACRATWKTASANSGGTIARRSHRRNVGDSFGDSCSSSTGPRGNRQQQYVAFTVARHRHGEDPDSVPSNKSRWPES